MLESPEARAKLRRKLETWPDDRKSPVTINQGLELLDLVDSLEHENERLKIELHDMDSSVREMLKDDRQLEKEADWLAERCAKACIQKTEDCAFQPAYFMDKPCYGENCKKSFCGLNKGEWREAARKAVEQQNERK